MPMNRVQFQPGLSLPEFLTSFGTEAWYAEVVKRARWPGGFRCPKCDAPVHYVVGHGARKLFQCNACRHQTSLTAGGLMEHTKLPLTTWFLAVYLIGQAKTGISALALKRHLGVGYPTAWLPHQKINHAMTAREATERLGGSIQLDDAYLGGEREGGTAGRGSENKVPFVAAVSLDARGRPLHVRLTIVAGFTSLAITAWAQACLDPGSSVHSDGLACFAAVVDAGCLHRTTVVGRLKPSQLPQFKWINTILGNLKTTLAGTFHAIDYRKYAQGYLSAFAYRFNRRFDLRGLFMQLIVDTARCPPIRKTTIRHGFTEADC